MFDDAQGPPWLEQLNEEQRAAVTHRGGPLLILAGAGTGKTATLCARTAWLLTGGIPAERILLLTFTRRAAREMIERSRTLAERAVPSAGRVVGGTFHSVAHRMVRLHARSLGLGQGFGVLAAGDACDLMDLVREELGLAARGRRFPRAPTMLDIYSRTVNAGVPLPTVLAEVFPWCEEHRDALGECFRAYGARKRALSLLDLDDLLLYWRALCRDEVIGAQLGDAFDHVLVDEYQDVNGLQVDILRGLRARRRELTAVGDDFQAIYGFRAASARHILEFPAQFEGTRTVTLVRNYRSSSAILAVANGVSAQDEQGWPKQLRSERDGGPAPELVFPLDEGAQAVEVCERVLAAREQRIALREQAVLFRAGGDSALLELELTRRDIPFVKYGGLRYLDAAHVKDLLAAVRLAGNEGDELSWFRLLQLLEGVGPVRARRALDALRGSSGQPPQLDRWPLAARELPAECHAHAHALVEVLGQARELTARVCVERLCAALSPLIRLRYADAAARLSDFEQLAAAARGAASIEEFAAELALDPPSSSSDLAAAPHLDEDFLVLSTVHSAKGLEWEAVHLIAAYDGNIPADMNLTSSEGLAEERRLLYVALTRARRRLHVYVPLRYHHRPGRRDDAHGYAKASRFLSDEVQRLFTVTRSAEADAHRPSRGTAPGRRIEVSADALFA